MTIALDTSAYSFLMRGHPELAELIRTTSDLSISTIVIGELRAGFRHGSRSRTNETVLERFLSSRRVRTLDVDVTTASRYAEISSYLRRQGTPLPSNDIWIAAQAMQHGLQVATLDRHSLKMPQVSTLLFAR